MQTSQHNKYPHWPLDKIQKIIAKNNLSASSPKQFYVLLTTGAMNPIHNGHVQSVRHCAQQLSSSSNNNNNAIILGAFISPSSDCYLAGKFRNKSNDFFFPASIRYEACAKAVEGDEFISVGGYEVSFDNRWPDFPEVCANLQETLNREAAALFSTTTTTPPPSIQVIYTCGSDHFNNCGLSRGVSMGNSLGRCKVAVTARGKEELEQLKKSYPPSENYFILESLPGLLGEISSTKVRMALKDLMGGVVDPKVIATVLSLSGK